MLQLCSCPIPAGNNSSNDSTGQVPPLCPVPQVFPTSLEASAGMGNLPATVPGWSRAEAALESPYPHQLGQWGQQQQWVGDAGNERAAEVLLRMQGKGGERFLRALGTVAPTMRSKSGGTPKPQDLCLRGSASAWPPMWSSWGPGTLQHRVSSGEVKLIGQLSRPSFCKVIEILGVPQSIQPTWEPQVGDHAAPQHLAFLPLLLGRQ